MQIYQFWGGFPLLIVWTGNIMTPVKQMFFFTGSPYARKWRMSTTIWASLIHHRESLIRKTWKMISWDQKISWCEHGKMWNEKDSEWEYNPPQPSKLLKIWWFWWVLWKGNSQHISSLWSDVFGAADWVISLVRRLRHWRWQLISVVW